MLDRVPETRSDWALRRLRAAILTGEFRPGARLRAEELAESWQVSPTPVREAFQRLGGTGLVEVTPQRGARVAAFTLTDAADLYALRLRLEPAVLEESLARTDAAHRADVTAAHERLVAARTLAEAAEAHLAFHAALLARCPSAWTKRVVADLAQHAQRYVALGAQAYRFGHGRDAAVEHAALRDAVLAGDGARGASLLADHLRGTLDAVRAALAARDASPAAAPTTDGDVAP